jgi:ATP-dependent Lon protease
MTKPIIITKDRLVEYVGTPKFNIDRFYEKTPVGVAMGLAYNEVGGSMLYVSYLHRFSHLLFDSFRFTLSKHIQISFYNIFFLLSYLSL